MGPHKVGIMSQLKSNNFSTRVGHCDGSQNSEEKTGEISLFNMIASLKNTAATTIHARAGKHRPRLADIMYEEI